MGVSLLIFPAIAKAQTGDGGLKQVGAAAPTSVLQKSAELFDDGVLLPAIAIRVLGLLGDVISGLVERAAYESAVYVATGGPGQDSLFFSETPTKAWKNYGLDLAGHALDSLSDEVQRLSDSDFDICAPNSALRFSIALGIKQAYQPPPAPRCDFRTLDDNWEAFTATAIETANNPGHFILNEMAKGFDPTQNQLGASIGITLKVHDRVVKDKQLNFLDQINSAGFKPLTDLVTGEVKTPSNVLQNQLNNALNAPAEARRNTLQNELLSASNLGIAGAAYAFDLIQAFSGTFINTWLNRTLTGLFEPKPQKGVNLGDYLGSGSVSREDAEASFSKLLANNPISISNYNVLGEFSICSAQNGVLGRGINNCVMDNKFVSAIAQGRSNGNYTVKEAIEKNFLRGDWPLIPPTDQARNQDAFCYTYGYCYGNLVKMRKARILPVGWEIAAKQNDPGSPATLQEVMDGFYDCNAEGNWDENHKWCHLIDPNWVLKYPETQCRATAFGEILSSSLSGSRTASCVDTPSCIAEGSNGECVGGYGYCTREKNVWQFAGKTCPAEFASCLSFTNTRTNDRSNVLLNTVDYTGCNQSNAGCRWYRTQQMLDDKGTPETSDDTFEWLKSGTEYDVALWDSSVKNANQTTPASGLDRFAYQDRIYVNGQATECPASQNGCTELNVLSRDVVLNLVDNPEFADDLNSDGVPDGWSWRTGSDVVYTTNEDAGLYEANSVLVGAAKIEQDGILLAPNTFYTLSFHGRGSGEAIAEIHMKNPVSGVPVSVADRSYGGVGCVVMDGANIKGFQIKGSVTDSEYKRFSCSFTTPSTISLAKILLSTDGGSVRFDGIQLEVGEILRAFTVGYASNAAPVYLKVPPAEFNCSGRPTDPAECEGFAKVCNAQDVGCNLYSPLDGDPAVPAVAGAIDSCPNECVGYASHKQEETRYEGSSFPVSFIPATATSCSSAYVGCDSFTNLSSVAAGGESVSYFTKMRACQTQDQSIGRSDTFYTWEGSDKDGYQLQTWSLLKSNVSDNGTAPCTSWQQSNETQIVCTDVAGAVLNQSCNDHEDIYTNPDCREFYDGEGIIHYRLFSETVSIDNACTPYRKNTSNQADCTRSGGLWLDGSECRYQALASASASCPAEANGCRAYTGGTGRNATILLNETFESGNYDDFEQKGGASLVISNESLSAGGRSLQMVAPLNAGLSTVYDAQTGQGVFSDKLIGGKTFTLEFWAKGSGSLNALLVDNGGEDDFHQLNEQPLQLTQNWQKFSIGPIDTSSGDFSSLDGSAVLQLKSTGGGTTTAYIDNIYFRQAEETLYVVKDSWKTPLSCDTAPNGDFIPEYYLGCEAYRDQKGQTSSLYQFTRLCSESVVGCQAFFDTQNTSTDPGSLVRNVRCESTNPDFVANQVTDCKIDTRSYCSIATGRKFCTFSQDFALPTPLPTGDGFQITYGPETVVIPNDVPVYLVDNGTVSCSAANIGCQEVGVPVYRQDKKKVVGFESKFLLNQPALYDKILCDQAGLFCEEWSSTQDGNFYFKDAGTQKCDYRTGVRIGGTDYSGWFREGTNDPCSFADTDDNGRFDTGETPLLVGGTEFGLPRNADNTGSIVYGGFVGSCPQQYDLCTEFKDPTDSVNGKYLTGKPYFYLNNSDLTQKTNQGSDSCRGQVSQKSGCALFNNTTNPSLPYAAQPSYMASVHADVLFGDKPNSLQAPIDCSNPATTNIQLTGGGNINLCKTRCSYNVGTGVDLETLSVGSGDTEYVGSCVTDVDCPSLKATDGGTYNGKCVTIADPTPQQDTTSLFYKNDANMVVEVNQNRECAEWLACKSNQASWDPNSGKWVNLCNEIGLCNEYSTSGDASFCSSWVESTPEVLSKDKYANRNISWSGLDYSGYSIPEQLPIDLQEPVNLNPKTWCVTNSGEIIGGDNDEPFKTCITADECGDNTKCVTAEDDTILAFNAGTCDEPRGSACTIGFCGSTNTPCTNSNDCNGNDECVIGSCQITDTTEGGICSDDNGCTGGYRCDVSRGQCVLDTGAKCTTENRSCGGSATCSLSPLTKVGSCYNGSCLTNVYAEKVSKTEGAEAEKLSCRGYPEVDSPFASIGGKGIVDSWFNPVEKTSGISGVFEKDYTPYSLKNGFSSANTCAPVKLPGGGWGGSDCSCNYQKITYGKTNAISKYYPEGYDLSNKRTSVFGICSAGPFEGVSCFEDSDCQDPDVFYSQGTCLRKTSAVTHYGFKGFCLERDSSIQLFSSGDNKNRACLTWLPVDQFPGSTDLFAKNPEAGLAPEDTFYCADVVEDRTGEMTFRNENNERYGYLKTTSNFRCVQGGSSDSDDTMICPIGFFAVRSGFGSASNDCTETDQAPYFCAPTLSFHTTTRNEPTFSAPIKAGDPCYPPRLQSAHEPYDNFVSSFGVVQNESPYDARSGGYSRAGNFVYIMATNADWVKAHNFYRDCQSPTMPHKYLLTMLNNNEGHFSVADGFYDAYVELWGVCESLVQVNSTQIKEGALNVNGKNIYNLALTDNVRNATLSNIGSWSGNVPGLGDRQVPGYTLDTTIQHPPIGAALTMESFILNNLGVNSPQVAIRLDHSKSLTSPFILSSDDSVRRINATVDSYSFGGPQLYTPQIIYTANASDSRINNSVGAGSNIVVDIEEKNEGARRLSELFARPVTKTDSYYKWFVGWAFASRIAEESPNIGWPIGNENEEGRWWIFGEHKNVSSQPSDPWDIWSTIFFAGGMTPNSRNIMENQFFQNTAQPIMGRYENKFWSLGQLTQTGASFDSTTSSAIQVPFEAQEAFAIWTKDTTNNSSATPPIIKSVGACEGNLCQEGADNTFSVNGTDAGFVDGGKGYKNVLVSFYTYANPNQLPIRGMNVDWGDGNFLTNPDIPWPTDSQSGSDAGDNFYKNRRGLEGRTEVCREGTDAGKLSTSCDSSYVSFNHGYSCTQKKLQQLRDAGRFCEIDPITRALKNSPCTDGEVDEAAGKCIFQPRVHVEDNWGWCTGYCDADLDLNNDTVIDHPSSNKSCYATECNLSCPDGQSGSGCREDNNGETVNPWINFDGYVRVSP